MAEKQQNEIDEFKQLIRELLASLGKITTEKDLRKAYRDHTGHNVNDKIHKFDAGSLCSFLRFQCQSICDVYRKDGEIRIQRLYTESTQELTENMRKDDKKKKHKKNLAPKLNNPRMGIINQTNYNRANPQGFNKKTNKQNHPVTKFSLYRENPGCNIELEENLYDAPPLTKSVQLSKVLAPKINYKAAHFDESSYRDDDTPRNIMLGDNGEVVDKKPQIAQNSFELSPLSQEEGYAISSTTQIIESQHQEAEESDGKNELDNEDAQQIKHVEEQLKELCLNVQSPILPEKHFESLNVPIDDPIFLLDYPDIIQNPKFKVANPKLKHLSIKICFDIHITFVHSPTMFLFQYGDSTLRILMNEMKEFYTKLPAYGLAISQCNCVADLIVCGDISGTWVRAQVINKPNDSGVVQLFLLDFGTQNVSHISNIRYLLKRFSRIPIKSLRGSIVGIMPKDNKTEWTFEARMAFLQLVRNKRLFATIRYHIKENNVYELEIWERLSSSESVSEVLIHQGLGDIEPISESFPYAIPLPIGDMTDNVPKN